MNILEMIIVLINQHQHLKPDIIGDQLNGENNRRKLSHTTTVAMGQKSKGNRLFSVFCSGETGSVYRNEMLTRSAYDELENSQNLLLPHSYKSELLRQYDKAGWML
ncbi:MAG: hypothetical protein ACLUJ0_12995 [Ruthenibacterium lactatiformans]